MLIEKQIKKLLPNKKNVFVRWETSYNYTTKTSRRRGGYNRTRRGYYWIGENGSVTKIDAVSCRVDELTGQYQADLHSWLVPIPKFWMEHEHPITVRCNGVFPEEKSVQDIKYCEYFGTKESAEILASKGEGEPVLFKKKPADIDVSVGDCIVRWGLFFGVKPKNNYKIFCFRDGERSEDDFHSQTEERLILIKEPKQLPLF